MKKLIIFALATLLMVPAFAQNKKSQSKAKSKAPETTVQENAAPAAALVKVYDEERDPMEMLEEAMEQARNSDHLVIAQVGGNWCPWCLQFAQLVTTEPEIAQVIKENFVYVHINVPKDKTKRNPEIMKRLGNPGRFGYPALVVLDGEGQVLHIENSSYLEEGKGYNSKKVLQFFQQWTRKAIEDLK